MCKMHWPDSISVNAASKNSEAAWGLVRFVVGPDGQTAAAGRGWVNRRRYRETVQLMHGEDTKQAPSGARAIKGSLGRRSVPTRRY